MLRSMSFTNFKSWGSLDIKFARITGLFGTNSSGKTSLIQFILMLKQTKEATERKISLALNGTLVRLGSARDVVHRHDESRRLEWKLGFRLPSALALEDPSRRRTALIAKGNALFTSSEVGFRDGAPVARTLSYRLEASKST